MQKLPSTVWGTMMDMVPDSQRISATSVASNREYLTKLEQCPSCSFVMTTSSRNDGGARRKPRTPWSSTDAVILAEARINQHNAVPAQNFSPTRRTAQQHEASMILLSPFCSRAYSLDRAVCLQFLNALASNVTTELQRILVTGYPTSSLLRGEPLRFAHACVTFYPRAKPVGKPNRWWKMYLAYDNRPGRHAPKTTEIVADVGGRGQVTCLQLAPVGREHPRNVARDVLELLIETPFRVTLTFTLAPTPLDLFGVHFRNGRTRQTAKMRMNTDSAGVTVSLSGQLPDMPLVHGKGDCVVEATRDMIRKMTAELQKHEQDVHPPLLRDSQHIYVYFDRVLTAQRPSDEDVAAFYFVCPPSRYPNDADVIARRYRYVPGWATMNAYPKIKGIIGIHPGKRKILESIYECDAEWKWSIELSPREDFRETMDLQPGSVLGLSSDVSFVGDSCFNPYHSVSFALRHQPRDAPPPQAESPSTASSHSSSSSSSSFSSSDTGFPR